MNPIDLELADLNLAHNIDLLRFSAGERKKVLSLLLNMQKELRVKLLSDLTDFGRARVEKLLNESSIIIKEYYEQISPTKNIMGYEIKYIDKKPKDYYGKHFPESKTIEIYTKGRTTQEIQATLEHELGHVVDYTRRGIKSSPFGDSIMGYDGELRAAMDSDIYFRDTRKAEAEAIRKAFPKTHSLATTQKEIYADAYKLYINEPEKLKEIAPRIYKELDDYLIKTQLATTKAIDYNDLAKHEADFQAQSLAKVGLEASLPSEFALKALVNGSVIEGAPSGAWWAKQAQDTAFKFAQQVRQGIAQGETLQQIIIRVAGSKRLGTAGIMEVSRRNASALVHTSIMQVAGDAREAFIKANEDVYKGYRWLSTLDGHVCPKCIPRSGAMWDLNHNPIEGNSIPYHTTPLHFSCRCVILGITKSYRDLGLNVDEMKPGTRASDLGQVPADMSFEGFLGRHNKEYADDLLGKGRADLWRKGKITLSDLLDSNGRELSFSQLKAKL